jgi:anti-sigma regulatory factor (Ser/Thr protein kinase)
METVRSPRLNAPSGGAASPDAFRHEVLLYSGIDGFFESTLRFIRDALEHDEPILVVAGLDKIRGLQADLNSDGAGRAFFADIADVGHNPARIIPAWHDFLDEYATDGRRVRGIGEPIYPGRDSDELVECQRHEELLNVAFAGGIPWWLVCPYDTSALEHVVIDEALCSHPLVWHGDDHGVSPCARPLDVMATPCDLPLPAIDGRPDTLMFSYPEDLRDVRMVVKERAVRAGLDPDQIAAVVLAADELAANSLRYGVGDGVLRMWSTDDGVVCEVESNSRIDAPLAGRSRPSFTDVSGRGLWLANQLCDLVQVRSFPTGSVIRVHMRRA